MPRLAPSRFPLGFWLLTLLARLSGGAKEVLLAMALGASPWKDALVVAWTAPALMASYCNEVLPPLLTPGWVRSAPAARGRGAGRLVAAFLAVQLALTAIVFCRPRWLIAAIAPGLPAATLALAVALERWLGLNLALLSGQALLTARLNAERRFALTPAARVLATVVLVAAVVGTRGWALPRRVTAIAAGLTGGNALALVALLAGWRARRPPPQRGVGPLRGATPLRSAGPLLLAMLIVNLIPLAERMAASRLRPGSLAAYDYGERLVQLVFSLSVAPFTAVAFTRLSELAAADGAAFLRHLESSLGALLRLAMSCAAGLAVFSRLLTRCVFGWGHFTAAAVAATAPVVALKGAGLGLDAAVYFLLFALYARGRAVAKLPVALVLAGCNVPLAFVAAARWGLAGLAAAHVVSYGCGLGWLGLRRRHYLPGLRWRPVAAAAGRAGALAFSSAVAARTLLPRAAVAGALGGAASCAWALAAVALTAGAGCLLARWIAPDLLAGSQASDGLGLRGPQAVARLSGARGAAALGPAPIRLEART